MLPPGSRIGRAVSVSQRPYGAELGGGGGGRGGGGAVQGVGEGAECHEGRSGSVIARTGERIQQMRGGGKRERRGGRTGGRSARRDRRLGRKRGLSLANMPLLPSLLCTYCLCGALLPRCFGVMGRLPQRSFSS